MEKNKSRSHSGRQADGTQPQPASAEPDISLHWPRIKKVCRAGSPGDTRFPVATFSVVELSCVNAKQPDESLARPMVQKLTRPAKVRVLPCDSKVLRY